MNTKAWYLPYYDRVYHTQNAKMHVWFIVHTMVWEKWKQKVVSKIHVQKYV